MTRPARNAPSQARHTAVPDILLAAGVLLARVPFLFAGYGTDPDAWGVALAGRQIARTHVYESARAPGNPVLELTAAALAGTPPWTLNALTAIMGTLAVVFFGMLLRRLGCRAWLAGALALAFTPVIAIHSADAMDYVWALAFLLAAWLAAAGRRPGLAGVLVGVATGCRITSLAMLVPLSIVVTSEGNRSAPARGRALATLWGAGVAAAALAFAPVFARSGLAFLHAYEYGWPRPLYLAKILTVDVWGAVGCLALAGAAIPVLLRRGRPPAHAAVPGGADRVLLAAGVAVAVELALFFRLPYDAGYLVPVVPFALLLFARALTRREFVALCAAVALSAFLVKVSEPGNLAPAAPGDSGFRFSLGAHALDLTLLPGPLVTDLRRREAGLRFVADVRAAARRLPGPATVAAGDWLPLLRVSMDGNREGGTNFVYAPSRAQVDSLRRGGGTLYDLPGAEACTQVLHGYSLRAAGSRALATR